MRTELQITKSLISPPSDTIHETITHCGISISDLSEKLGLNVQSVNDLIEGIDPITAQIANKLEKALKIPVSFWINRETGYRLELHEIQKMGQHKIGKINE